MMTSLGVTVSDPDGTDWEAASFEKADVIGTLLGEMALDAVASAEPIADPQLRVRTDEMYLPVVNQAFQAMFLLDVIGDRETYNWDPEQLITDDNLPEVLTAVDVIEVGSLQWLTVPGELLPELWIGGYDGSYVNAPDHALVDPGNAYPPDLAAAPGPPYLKERMTASHRWLIGMGNDELGYLIPEYDFVVHPDAPYLFEADGDHYEEINSLGPQTAGLVEEQAVRLVQWEAP